MYMITQNGCSPATFLIKTESRNTSANSEQNMAEMASDGSSPHSPSLRLGLPTPQPTTRHRLSLRPCTAPPSCSLQPLLKLTLLSLRPPLLQFVSIVSPLLNHGNLIFEPVCVFLPLPLLPLLFWWKWISALSPCLQFDRYHHSDSTITFPLV